MAEEGPTGKWDYRHIEENGFTYRVVFGVFELHTDEEKRASRGGKPLDICQSCAVTLLSSGKEAEK
jgi:hypothetical protein